MYPDDLPLVFVSRLEVALRFHSAEGTRISTTSTNSKVINLKLEATLFLSVAATYLLSNQSISTCDKAPLSRLSPKLGKYCVLLLGFSFGCSPVNSTGLVYLSK